ncbi:MAG: YdcF family protein [Alphaproteobacteria bacterium]|nr:YdcF family protein [Alphaproteobacteria bacterium]
MRPIVTVCAALLLAWFIALLLFVQRIPAHGTTDDTSTDAIVALTGGVLRLERGFQLLGRDKAPILFISGVGKTTTRDELLREYGTTAIKDKIQKNAAELLLDYAADSTYTNAHEAARMIRSRGLTTIRLVTSNYHMPRSVMEFERAIPEVFVIPDAVMPPKFQTKRWWADSYSRTLVLREFHKYWLVWFRTRIHRA